MTDQERLLTALRESPDGLTRTEIAVNVFGKNKKSSAITELLEGLLSRGLIHRSKEPSSSTAGRPSEWWFARKGPNVSTINYPQSGVKDAEKVCSDAVS